MKFSVEAWDPGYGSPLEGEMQPSTATVDTAVESSDWAPVKRRDVPDPGAIMFVDGVRRIDARVWIENGETASPGICASYAAGVVICTNGKSHVAKTEVRRSIVTTSKDATDIATGHGTYRAVRTVVREGSPVAMALSNKLQRQLYETEVTAAVEARADYDAEDDLLVVDGPLRDRSNLPRAIGYIKTHHAEYLPAELNAVVSALDSGERSPIFMLGTSWDRYAWYLRLPCPRTTPWGGIVRIEAASDLTASDVVALANLSQAVLPRYASVEYKDSRAPQNLVPIAGLERALKHRLGDASLAYRSLRASARS